MTSKRINLTLIRHGQTTHNKLKIIQGQMETHLTDLGRNQAKLLADYLTNSNLKYSRVYSSDLIRAYETCQIVCGGNYDILKDQLLRERSFGVLQGSPLANLRNEAFKAGYNESNFTQFRPEGGETMDEVLARVEKFCNKLFADSPDLSSIMIVTHGGVIREFMKLFKKLGCQLESKDFIVTPNTALNEFEVETDGSGLIKQIKIKYLHHIPHLKDNALSEALNEEQLNDASTKKKEVEYAI